MKKFGLILICCLALTACTPPPSPESTSNKPTINKETNIQPSTTGQQPTIAVQDSAGKNTEVPLPQREDIIRTFFALINEKRIPEAISMMSPTMVPDDATKQAWGVQFNDIESIEVRDIELTDTNLFKVSLLTKVNPRVADAPIPYYGWGDTPDVRFVQLVKNDQGQWQINSLATGP